MGVAMAPAMAKTIGKDLRIQISGGAPPDSWLVVMPMSTASASPTKNPVTKPSMATITGLVTTSSLRHLFCDAHDSSSLSALQRGSLLDTSLSPASYESELTAEPVAEASAEKPI
jgi:hypothetical protein